MLGRIARETALATEIINLWNKGLEIKHIQKRVNDLKVVLENIDYVR